MPQGTCGCCLRGMRPGRSQTESERARLAAVDGDACTRYPTRAGAAEEGDDVPALLRAAEALERDLPLHERAGPFGIVREPPLPRAAGVQDAARRHRAAGEPRRAQLRP